MIFYLRINIFGQVDESLKAFVFIDNLNFYLIYYIQHFFIIFFGSFIKFITPESLFLQNLSAYIFSWYVDQKNSLMINYDYLLKFIPS